MGSIHFNIERVMIMKDKYFVSFIPNSCFCPICEDRDILQEYLRMYGIKKPIIYTIAKEKLSSLSLSGKWFVEEVTEQVADVYCTDTDMEMICTVLDSDLLEILDDIKRLKKVLRMFDTPESKKLRKQLKAFTDEYIENPDLSLPDIDTDDPMYRLIHKLNLKKYLRSLLSKRFKDPDLGSELPSVFYERSV